uniref:Uncharacterized protein n=1 Tax=Anguilla anguilla TaxID=7936 RepID=A0A0E9RVI5_ANGAN
MAVQNVALIFIQYFFHGSALNVRNNILIGYTGEDSLISGFSGLTGTIFKLQKSCQTSKS